MIKYRFLEHTADILFEALGSSFKEALENAARALFEVVGEAEAKEERIVEAEAPARDELVVVFLSNLITEMDIEGMVFSDVKIVELTEDHRFYVRAKVWGEHTLPKECVKGVTYHMLKVEKKNGFWRIQVLLDV